MNDNKNKIYAVGLGPGNLDLLSPRALEAIKRSEVIIGYGLYVEYIESLIGDKEVCSSGMTKEVDRCSLAFQKARTGKTVSVISSGDSGIYGMAGLLYELSEKEENKDIAIEVIPGITAANAAAAVLGAPLMNDFAVISLSDLLTPKEIILKRVTSVAKSGLVCVLYNPMSKRRKDIFYKTIEVFIEYRGSQYAGIVKNASKDNEEVFITTLDKINDYTLDMSTLVIIGNENTVFKNGRLYTLRGYKDKYIESFNE